MSRDIWSGRLVRLNNLCAFVGSRTQRGMPTPLDLIIRTLEYDEGVKDRRSAMRQLQRDVKILETSYSAPFIRDMKKNTLRLEPAEATEGGRHEIDASWDLPAAS